MSKALLTLIYLKIILFIMYLVVYQASNSAEEVTLKCKGKPPIVLRIIGQVNDSEWAILGGREVNQEMLMSPDCTLNFD